MQRAVTAIYRSYDVANLVRDELERLGIARHNITVVPDRTTLAAGGDTTPRLTVLSLTTTTQDPATDDEVYWDNFESAVDRLHDLHLPEADTRIYQQAIRNGDHVVSVSVAEDDDLAGIEQVMRRPEHAHHLDELDITYAGADYVPRRQPLGEAYDERMVGRRDDDQLSPYTRTYRRDAPLLIPPIALAPLGTR